MQKFTDNAGREWNIQLTPPILRDVMKATGINLSDLSKFGDGDTIQQLAGDPAAYYDTLVILLAGQMEAAGVTDESLGCQMDEDVVEDSIRAIVLAAIDISPKAGRETLRRSFLRSWNHTSAQRDKQAAKMNEMVASGELDKLVDKALEETLATS